MNDTLCFGGLAALQLQLTLDQSHPILYSTKTDILYPGAS
jgi:hypothetical protein